MKIEYVPAYMGAGGLGVMIGHSWMSLFVGVVFGIIALFVAKKIDEHRADK